MLTAILIAIKQFLLGLISLATLIAIIVGVLTGQPVANAPTAASASITTNEDTASAPVTPSVTDPDAGDTFTFSIASQPANGSAVVVNNQLVYTPAAGDEEISDIVRAAVAVGDRILRVFPHDRAA